MKMRKLFVVSLDFQIWTGSTVLRREDFRLGENGQLPPDDLVENLSCKKLIDTKHSKSVPGEASTESSARLRTLHRHAYGTLSHIGALRS